MSDIAALTPAEKRKITIAAREEKARQEQVALEAEASEPDTSVACLDKISFFFIPGGGRKAKNDANKNASMCPFSIQRRELSVSCLVNTD
jgi:hypothetical protein